MKYDADDRVIETTLPNGQKETRSYDAIGRLITRNLIGATTSTTTYTYDANGNLLTETIDGKTTTYAYDLFDRRTTATDALGTVTSFTYDKNNNITDIQVKNSSGTLMSRISTTYDALGQVLQTTEYAINTGLANRVSKKLYDKTGKILIETDAR